MKIIREGRNRAWMPNACVVFSQVEGVSIAASDVVAVDSHPGVLQRQIQKAVELNSAIMRIMNASRGQYG